MKRLAHTGLFLLLVLAIGLAILVSRPAPSLLDGIIWQPTNDYPRPQGRWHLLGADSLLVQWSLNDNLAWLPSTQFAPQPRLPDWDALGREPWASRIILGLASRMRLDDARRHWQRLGHQGAMLAEDVTFPVAGWYAPIEFSPDWRDAEAYRAYLDTLPRPRYVSSYGGYEMTPRGYASWVASWLPEDAILLYQDGVGVGQQTPAQARARADALVEVLGPSRLIMVMEAFRLRRDGQVGPARLSQLIDQLRRYRGLEVYAFSARHLRTHQVLALRLLAPWLF